MLTSNEICMSSVNPSFLSLVSRALADEAGRVEEKHFPRLYLACFCLPLSRPLDQVPCIHSEASYQSQRLWEVSALTRTSLPCLSPSLCLGVCL